MTQVDVRRAAERDHTKISWLDSKHSFSFGSHYDPTNTHHGLLLVNNDDVVAPGTGFETHPHRDMEIVTWVLRGSLVHQDSVGNSGLIYPGLAQRMSAGTGILHSEKNDSRPSITGVGSDGSVDSTASVHFVQMWVVPDATGAAPGYEQLEIDETVLRGKLTTVASGMERDRHESAIRIGNRDAALYAARLQPGEAVTLPDAPYVNLFVPVGWVELEEAGMIGEGDAVRLTGAGTRRVTTVAQTTVLVWEMHATLA